MKKELSERKKRFCLEYIKDFNASRAYVAAGYALKYSNTNAWKLLQDTTIQKYMSELKVEYTDKAEISIEWIIKELKELHRRCTEGRLEVHGATKSLEMLGKYLGMFVDKLKVTGDIKINVIKFADIEKSE